MNVPVPTQRWYKYTRIDHPNYDQRVEEYKEWKKKNPLLWRLLPTKEDWRHGGH